MKTGYGFKELETIDEFSKWLDELKVTRKITHLQVHHTYQPDYSCWAKDTALKRQYNMKYYHIHNNGWDDIAQHLTITPNGHFVTGRDFNKTPIGIKGWNTNAVCVEIYGNFDLDIMTSAQKNAVIACYALLSKKFNISINISNIRPHCWFTAGGKYIGDYNSSRSCKSCPGKKFIGGNSKDAFTKNFIKLVKTYDTSNLTGSSESTDIVNFKIQVIVDKLNVRTGPSTSYAQIGSITDKGKYTITSINSAGTWGLVKELDGWICITEKYVEKIQSSTEMIIKIIVDVLNIRTGPGTTYDKVGTLFKDDVYTIVELNSQGTWGKLKSGAGWISLNKNYVTKVEVAKPQPIEFPETKFMVKVRDTVEELNVRSGPGTKYDVVEKIFAGDVYTIVEKEGSWGKLLSGLGWICINEEYVVDIVK